MRILLPLLALATPVAARDLPVAPGKAWQHGETGLALPATLDGLPRTRLADSTATEHDVTAEFAIGGFETVATVFVYHPAVDDVAIWFDRSQTALYDRALFGEVSPASPDPVAFAPPGSDVPSALRRVYAPGKGPYRGTALAMMPLGEWLVAIRLSSKAEGPAALDARLSRIVAALGWPAAAAPAPALEPVAVCPAPLAFDTAKRVKSQGADVLLSLIGGLAPTSKGGAPARPAERVRWCRDPSSTSAYGVYRNADRGTGYTIAIQDAGRAVFVTPALDTQLGKGTGYSIAYRDVDGTTTSFAGFDRLPQPRQVIDALSGPRLGTSKGTQVTLAPGAL